MSEIEEIYKKNISEFYGLLVEHFIEAENYEKGDIYSKLAAQKALRAASFKEAIDYTKKSIFCLESLPRTETIQRKIIDDAPNVFIYTVRGYRADRAWSHYNDYMHGFMPFMGDEAWLAKH